MHDDGISTQAEAAFLIIAKGFYEAAQTGDYDSLFQSVRNIADSAREKLGAEIGNKDPGEIECRKLNKSKSKRKSSIGQFFYTDNIVLSIFELNSDHLCIDILKAGYAIGTVSALGMFRTMETDAQIAMATKYDKELRSKLSRAGKRRAENDEDRITARVDRVKKFTRDNPDIKSASKIAKELNDKETRPISDESLAVYIRKIIREHNL